MLENLPLKHILSRLARPCKGNHLFILAEPRSGSSWLFKTLNSHPEIKIYGELLNPRSFHAQTLSGGIMPQNDSQRLNFIKKNLETGQPCFTGFKALLPHIHSLSPTLLARLIRQYPHGHYILLFRENPAMSRISLNIAHAYNIWHVKNPSEITKRRVTIHPEVFLRELEKALWLREYISTLLTKNGVKSLIISYEQLFGETEKKLMCVLDFLNLQPQELKWNNEIKGNPFRPSETVENYDELEAFLRPYPSFHHMLLEAEISGDALPKS